MISLYLGSGVSDMSQSAKHNLESGLEAVRAFRPRSMEVLSLIQLARLFSAKVCLSIKCLETNCLMLAYRPQN